MSNTWIRIEDYTMETLLYFDRWIIRYIMDRNDGYNNATRDYLTDVGKALSRYPYVVEYCKRKAPECSGFIEHALLKAPQNLSGEDERNAELAFLDYHYTFVVYAYPEVMEKVNYIRNWNAKRLYELIDLTDKIVLDVGAGTGRLSFAAVTKAKRVYSSEPCDMLREYMRDVINKKGITNMKVLDGIVTDLPYEDDTFDVVMSGHVIGDFYDREINEISRVAKNGGWLIICNGDDEVKRIAPDKELIQRGFSFFRHESIEKGIIYNYRKQVIKF